MNHLGFKSNFYLTHSTNRLASTNIGCPTSFLCLRRRLSLQRYETYEKKSFILYHSQVKEKSYHSSFYFWAIWRSDVTSQPFWPIRNIVYVRFGESEPLFCSDVISSNRARALIGQYRFYLPPIALIWLYLHPLSSPLLQGLQRPTCKEHNEIVLICVFAMKFVNIWK